MSENREVAGRGQLLRLWRGHLQLLVEGVLKQVPLELGLKRGLGLCSIWPPLQQFPPPQPGSMPERRGELRGLACFFLSP